MMVRCRQLVPLFVLLLGIDPVLAQDPARNANPVAPVATEKKRIAKPRAARNPPSTNAAATDAPKAKTEAKIEPKTETKTEPKDEPKTESKAEPKIAPKIEPKTDVKAEAATVLPPEERAKIQAALAWAGDFADIPKGEDALTAAIKNYQKRTKAPVTGALTLTQRTALLASARTHDDEFGWSVVADPATGIRIGLPAKLVPQVHDAAHGTRWSSAHGEVQIETFRLKDASLKLATLFEREKKEPASRKIEQNVLRDDTFFISGMQGLKYFSVRAQMREGEVRGFTIMYDQAWEGIVAPVMVAMASAFAPFPDRAAPYAALTKSVEYGTGLIVSGQGYIVTTRKLTEGCQVLVAPGLGDAERVADDETDGLALLRVYGHAKMPAASLATEAPAAGELILVGIPDPREQSGARKLTEIKARLAQGGAIELRQPVPVAGFAGAAGLDPQGRLIGVMQMRNAVLASTAATAAPMRLVDNGAIRRFLAAHNVSAASEQRGDARDSVVRIICVRK